MQYKHILHYSADPGIDLFCTYYVHAWVLNSGLQILAVKDRDLWVPCIDINFLIIWWFSLLFTVNSIGNLQFTGYYNQICSQYELFFTKQPISLSGDRFPYVSDIFFLWTT